jgi:hypothetical protein
MKLITEIDIEWVKPYFPMMVKVNIKKIKYIRVFNLLPLNFYQGGSI